MRMLDAGGTGACIHSPGGCFRLCGHTGGRPAMLVWQVMLGLLAAGPGDVDDLVFVFLDRQVLFR